MKLNVKITRIHNLICCLFFSISFFPETLFASSVFDQAAWEQVRDDKNVKLYYAPGGSSNYYKTEAVAEATLGMTSQDLAALLLDYEKYRKIFIKTTVFSPVKETPNGTVIYCRINFSPMKDRDYYILMRTVNFPGGIALEWQPYSSAELTTTEKDCLRVSQVYGRWILRDLPNGGVSLSTEYYNNWEYHNLSLKTVTPFEKDVAVNNMKQFLRYISKNTQKEE